MAKKIVRGITDVKTITNQDYDTNNVNDLLSDGQYNYIHRKKGKTEEYHNLTDNIKTLSSDNTELLSVTNNNKTTNTATLHPKHDAQKEQVLESTRNTITINHGTNGTAEKTTVDTNPQKVLEHENLISDSEYITLQHQTGDATTHIQTAALKQQLDGLGDNLQQIFQAFSSLHQLSINYFSSPDFSAVQHTVLNREKSVITFSFECYNAAETVITGVLKKQLALYVLPNTSISNSAITISNDGTTMKLINSAPSENVKQHATFTFYYFNDTPGGGDTGGGGVID